MKRPLIIFLLDLLLGAALFGSFWFARKSLCTVDDTSPSSLLYIFSFAPLLILVSALNPLRAVLAKLFNAESTLPKRDRGSEHWGYYIIFLVVLIGAPIVIFSMQC